MIYYGYTRVSTETQAEKGYGLDAQKSAIEKYAAENGFEIAQYFTDAGVSGDISSCESDDAINRRAGLIGLLAVLGKGDSVVVLNTSRLWRSDMTKAIIKRELMKRGAKVVSLEQPRYDLYSRDPGEYLINAVTEALDVYEKMNISLRLARGRTTKACSGAKPAGVCPYGYMYSADKKSVVINEAEADTVKRIFAYAQKGFSLARIAAALNDEGITTRRGLLWSRGSVQAILRNRFYIGELYHAGQQIKGTHPAIISRNCFGRAGAQLDRRRKMKKG